MTTILVKLKDSCTANLLATQMYLAGEPLNESDFLYQLIPEDRRRFVTVPLRKMRPLSLQGTRRRRLRARFDIVLGAAPCDPS